MILGILSRLWAWSIRKAPAVRESVILERVIQHALLRSSNQIERLPVQSERALFPLLQAVAQTFAVRLQVDRSSGAF